MCRFRRRARQGKRAAGRASAPPAAYWTLAPEQLLADLGSTAQGLSQCEADLRRARQRAGVAGERTRSGALVLLIRQFNNPLVLILIGAAVISMAVTEWIDAAVVLFIVFGSTLLGFAQEYVASHAIEALRARVAPQSTVLREGTPRQVASARIVAGDLVLLSAGSLVPADGVVLEADALFVNQSALTGETFPVEKRVGTSGETSSLAERDNCLFMGTSVSTGSARMLAVRTGGDAVFGQIAGELAMPAPLTEFERGVRQFGYLLTRIMLVMVLAVLAINIFLAKPPVDALLFALALAVGLTPELLPAIISITLSHGARRMARQGVIVRRLSAIENLGSMDVLCTDKTGTLTAGVVELDAAVGPDGKCSETVLRLACINAQFQTGLSSALDDAIRAAAARAGVDTGTLRKDGELPYDFVRKLLSVAVAGAAGERILVTKGALENVLAACETSDCAGCAGGPPCPLDAAARALVVARFEGWSRQGYRVLGVASKTLPAGAAGVAATDEHALCFAGFLLFMDPPKRDARETVADLERRGVSVKILTGDNHCVARYVAEEVGLQAGRVLTGRELNTMNAGALANAAANTAVFAEMDPNQKERVILALKRRGQVVGYMGDGINDALALRNADVGISVDTAVDIAKEAADFVLLRKDLGILRTGVDEGRRTFANTLKYVLTTISANFGNMFSMALASLFLPFLPLLASQILLNNLLSDIPAAAIASDRVDKEWVARPHRWDTVFIRDYMVLFGLLSSVFDLLAFAVLLWVFRATPAEFRTGWFVESLLTELAVALVVRTRRPFYLSRPGNLLLGATAAVIVIALALPYLPFSWLFGFVPLPLPLALAMVGLTLAYVLAVEAAKRRFYGRAARRGKGRYEG